jgi:1,6-anhydro-N-acetylmuramate kinase
MLPALSRELVRLRKIKKRNIAAVTTGSAGSGVGCCYLSLHGDSWAILGDSFFPYSQQLNLLLEAIAEGTACTRDVVTADYHLSSLYKEAISAVLKKVPHRSMRLHAIALQRFSISIPHPHNSDALPWNLSLGSIKHVTTLFNCPCFSDFIPALLQDSLPGYLPLSPGLTLLASDKSEPIAYLNVGLHSRLTVVDGVKKLVLVDNPDLPGIAVLNHFFNNGTHTNAIDRDGDEASQGAVMHQLVPRIGALLRHHAHTPQQSIEQIASLLECGETRDRLATLSAALAQTLFNLYRDFLPKQCPVSMVVLSGGGVYHKPFLQYLRTFFEPLPVVTTEQAYGLKPELLASTALGLSLQSMLQGQLRLLTTDTNSCPLPRESIGRLYL